MSGHTEGRLFVGQAPRCYAEDGGEVLVATKADPRHRDKAMENAHRAAACWNACEGMDDPEAEIARLRALVDSKADTVLQIGADLREALDLLAIAHDVWMNAAPHHRTGERIKVKSLLRKHGRLP